MSIHLVVKTLEDARRKTEQELDGIKQAIHILSKKKPAQSTRVLSAAARKRISVAQKKRWRLARKAA